MSLDPELRIHLAGCMKEIFETAPKVLGREWPEKLKKTNEEKILKSTERNTTGKPSMLLDWEEGRPLEVEAILGNPVSYFPRSGPHFDSDANLPLVVLDPNCEETWIGDASITIPLRTS